ncbi:MAG: glycosyltransferase [Acidobacteria bacterium]|nr:glycosyltransferase [Acidobacteriota bacterium]
MQSNETNSRIEGQDIICFANDWDSDPLSKKHIMLLLAQRNRVLWVNSIGTRNPQVSARDFRRSVEKLKKAFAGCERRAENLFLFSPLAIPFHGNRTAQRVNRRWLSWSLRRVCRQLGFRKPITWTFLPTSADVVGTLGEQRIIYHCVDEFSEFTGTDKAGLLEMERRLIQKADLVIVSSGPLYESKRLYNPKTFLVTHGVDVRHFRQACYPETAIAPELAGLKTPVIGFHGLIADWVDLELIAFLAAARPEWSFVLIGKLDTNVETVQRFPNVHLLGRKDYAVLPAYCKGFDVAILPFTVNELTLAANPLKLREYLAAGLPVVASAIPEAARLASTAKVPLRIGESYPHFLAQIEALLADGENGPRLAVSETMESESWEARVAEMSRIITGQKPLIAEEGMQAYLPTGLEESCLGNS